MKAIFQNIDKIDIMSTSDLGFALNEGIMGGIFSDIIVIQLAIEMRDIEVKEKICSEVTELLNSFSNQVDIQNVLIWPYSILSSSCTTPENAKVVFNELLKNIRKQFEIQILKPGYCRRWNINTRDPKFLLVDTTDMNIYSNFKLDDINVKKIETIKNPEILEEIGSEYIYSINEFDSGLKFYKKAYDTYIKEGNGDPYYLAVRGARILEQIAEIEKDKKLFDRLSKIFEESSEMEKEGCGNTDLSKALLCMSKLFECKSEIDIEEQLKILDRAEHFSKMAFKLAKIIPLKNLYLGYNKSISSQLHFMKYLYMHSKYDLNLYKSNIVDAKYYFDKTYQIWKISNPHAYSLLFDLFSSIQEERLQRSSYFSKWINKVNNLTTFQKSDLGLGFDIFIPIKNILELIITTQKFEKDDFFININSELENIENKSITMPPLYRLILRRLTDIIGREFFKIETKSISFKNQYQVPKSYDEFISLIKKLINRVKLDIEDRRGYEVFWNDDGTLRHERILQHYFDHLLSAYCRSFNIDMSREPVVGRGPVDFKFSATAQYITYLECKKSDHSNLRKLVKKQLPTYMKSLNVHTGFYVFFIVDKNDINLVSKIYKDKKQIESDYNLNLEFISIDITRDKKTASKL